MSDCLAHFLSSTAGDFGFTFIDACAIWQAVHGDFAIYLKVASEFNPETFYAAHEA